MLKNGKRCLSLRTETFHQALQNTVETLKAELTELINSLGLTYNIRKVAFERFNSYFSMLYAYNIIYIHIFAYFFYYAYMSMFFCILHKCIFEQLLRTVYTKSCTIL